MMELVSFTWGELEELVREGNIQPWQWSFTYPKTDVEWDNFHKKLIDRYKEVLRGN